MIAQAFFPGDDQFLKLFASLVTFGVGFVTRPLGAAVIGAYADRAGRKAALTVTLLMMAVGSGVVGLTPGYATIGIWAPIIFLLGILIAPVGLYIRSQLPDTIERHETHESGLAVLKNLFRHHSRVVLLGVFVICGGTVSTYVFNFMTTYAITHGVSEKVATLL